MAAYITAGEAEALLMGVGIEHVPTPGALEIASDNLDTSGPFVGKRYAVGQARMFPRSLTVIGDTSGQVPERLKRWVAIEAYRLDVNEEPAVQSMSVDQVGSKTYAAAWEPKAERLQKSLLRPYLLVQRGAVRSGQLVRG